MVGGTLLRLHSPSESIAAAAMIFDTRRGPPPTKLPQRTGSLDGLAPCPFQGARPA